ncbi:MAG: hypothetical protein K6G86_02860, partial [Bacteroidales bacterium]|nr:hypothetical protein [Bacteroidales bacterium]
MSARWFILSQVAKEGMHVIVLPTQEAAEYCAADLYHLIEGDRVFFLPQSGKNVERSNYKSTLGVQRTTAIGKILSSDGDNIFIVSYPDALAEEIPVTQAIREAVLKVKKGDEISHEEIISILSSRGFE